jgi:hypothetical protein
MPGTQWGLNGAEISANLIERERAQEYRFTL